MNHAQSDTKVFGSLTVTAEIAHDGGYSILATAGPDQYLTFTARERIPYRNAYWLIKQGGLAGTAFETIRAQVHGAEREALDEMTRTVDDAAVEIEDEARIPTVIAVAEAHRIVSDAAAQIAADKRPRTLATIKADFATVGLSRKPPVLRSKSGVETKPLSPAGQHLLDRIARNGGTIARGKGASSTQLSSLAAKGLVDLHYDETKLPRKVITGATLKENGWGQASEQARAEGQKLREAVNR